MFIRTSAALATAALLAGRAAAKTDIAGCVSSKTIAYGGASLIWYVPDTGEVCELLDCGGGRAPPKTTVPGCDGYVGTATYSPTFLPGFGAAAATPTSTSADTVATESSASEGSSSSEAASPSPTGSIVISASTSGTATFTAPYRVSSSSLETQTGASDSSAAVETQTGSSGSSAAAGTEMGSGSGSETTSSSAAGSGSGSGSVGSSTTNTPNGAALPTAAVKGAFGVMAGLAAGVAML
ncbi:hypothetical protein F4859DRAFT_86670 [Xylaria cf. heliscus]|nr:hypothetical protein F4859DRAFT_86670 [Xylaria cf. heliscus]